MKAFEKFIESDAFFPVLIVLLILLVLVFVWAILSSKKEAKERQLRKQNIKVDENAEIKIIKEGNEINQEEVQPSEPEEVETNEIKIVEEQIVDSANIDNQNITEVKEVDLSELPLVDIPIPEVTEETFAIPSIVVQPDEGIEVDISVPEKINEENVPQSENVTLEFTRPMNMHEDIGEKVEIPPMKEMVDEIGESVIDEPSKEIITEENHLDEAFNSTPNETRDINENVVTEEPKEYLGEKTEIFDFPDFGEELLKNNNSTDEDIETEIINAANKYIESIMAKN